MFLPLGGNGLGVFIEDKLNLFFLVFFNLQNRFSVTISLFKIKMIVMCNLHLFDVIVLKMYNIGDFVNLLLFLEDT